MNRPEQKTKFKRLENKLQNNINHEKSRGVMAKRASRGKKSMRRSRSKYTP